MGVNVLPYIHSLDWWVGTQYYLVPDLSSFAFIKNFKWHSMEIHQVNPDLVSWQATTIAAKSASFSRSY